MDHSKKDTYIAIGGSRRLVIKTQKQFETLWKKLPFALLFKGCDFEFNIKISDKFNNQHCHFEDCKFIENILIEDFNNEASFEDCQGKNINIEGKCDKLNFSGTNIFGNFTLNNSSTISSLTSFSEGRHSYFDSIIIFGNISKDFLCRSIIIRYLVVSSDSKVKLNINYPSYLESVQISGSHIDSNILFHKVHLRNLTLSNFVGSKNILFSECVGGADIDENILNNYKVDLNTFNKCNPQIEIKNSNLNNADFSGSDFSNMELSFVNSNLQGLQSPVFTFPKRIFSNNPHGYREVYRQLKHQSLDQNDSITAIDWHKKEMTALLKIISLNFYSVPNIFSKLGFASDFVIIFLSKVISNFGNSWARVLLFLVLVNMVLFILFLSFSGYFIFRLPLNSQYILENFRFFFIFSWEDLYVNEIKFYPSSILVFYLSKVINAYLVYQLLISFRKFNRRF